MQTTTIRISLSDAGIHRGRVPALCDQIEASLLKEALTHASVSADSMTIQVDVPTDRLIEAAALLRQRNLI